MKTQRWISSILTITIFGLSILCQNITSAMLPQQNNEIPMSDTQPEPPQDMPAITLMPREIIPLAEEELPAQQEITEEESSIDPAISNMNNTSKTTNIKKTNTNPKNYSLEDDLGKSLQQYLTQMSVSKTAEQLSQTTQALSSWYEQIKKRKDVSKEFKIKIQSDLAEIRAIATENIWQQEIEPSLKELKNATTFASYKKTIDDLRNTLSRYKSISSRKEAKLSELGKRASRNDAQIGIKSAAEAAALNILHNEFQEKINDLKMVTSFDEFTQKYKGTETLLNLFRQDYLVSQHAEAKKMLASAETVCAHAILLGEFAKKAEELANVNNLETFKKLRDEVQNLQKKFSGPLSSKAQEANNLYRQKLIEGAEKITEKTLEEIINPIATLTTLEEVIAAYNNTKKYLEHFTSTGLDVEWKTLSNQLERIAVEGATHAWNNQIESLLNAIKNNTNLEEFKKLYIEIDQQTKQYKNARFGPAQVKYKNEYNKIKKAIEQGANKVWIEEIKPWIKTGNLEAITGNSFAELDQAYEKALATFNDYLKSYPGSQYINPLVKQTTETFTKTLLTKVAQEAQALWNNTFEPNFKSMLAQMQEVTNKKQLVNIISNTKEWMARQIRSFSFKKAGILDKVMAELVQAEKTALNHVNETSQDQLRSIIEPISNALTRVQPTIKWFYESVALGIKSTDDYDNQTNNLATFYSDIAEPLQILKNKKDLIKFVVGTKNSSLVNLCIETLERLTNIIKSLHLVFTRYAKTIINFQNRTVFSKSYKQAEVFANNLSGFMRELNVLYKNNQQLSSLSIIQELVPVVQEVIQLLQNGWEGLIPELQFAIYRATNKQFYLRHDRKAKKFTFIQE